MQNPSSTLVSSASERDEARRIAIDECLANALKPRSATREIAEAVLVVGVGVIGFIAGMVLLIAACAAPFVAIGVGIGAAWKIAAWLIS